MIRIRKIGFRQVAALVLFVLSALCFFWASMVAGAPGDTIQAAERLEKHVKSRLELLDTYMERALEGDVSQWMELDDIPMDMVVYRYVDNVLQSWQNSFVVSNEDISNRFIYQRLSNPRNAPSSQLADVREHATYMNLGQQWFLMKSRTEDNVKVIAGLLILDQLDMRSVNNANPRLFLNDHFSVVPLSTSGGTAVEVDGVPVFKVSQESLRRTASGDALVIWLGLALFLIGLLLHLSSHRTVRGCCLVVLAIVGSLALFFFWGDMNSGSGRIFSPTLYADGPVLYSLAAVIIINMAVFLITLCFYLVRRTLFRRLLRSEHADAYGVVYTILVVGAAVGIMLYAHMAFTSIIMNSNIELELYKLTDLSPFSAVVYCSFVGLLACIPLLFQMLRPVFKKAFQKKFDFLSPLSRVVFAILMALYFVLTASVLGLHKEIDRTEVWADRLSMDRDIQLELSLRLVENSIAEDPVLSALTSLTNANSIVTNRIIESYLSSVTREYNVSAMVFNAKEQDPFMLTFFNDRIRSGTKIHDQSRFMYSTSISGHIHYSGLFTFFSPLSGVNYLVISIEPKASQGYGGYYDILDMSTTSKVTMPVHYSYARYNRDMLATYSGTFAYPTIVSDNWKHVSEISGGSFVYDGYLHFTYSVTDDEIVVISRKKQSSFGYLVAIIFIALVCFFFLSLLSLTRRRRQIFKNTYFRSRITFMVMVSLLLTLVVLASVSMVFVYQRNESNRKDMMSEKINSIQTMMTPDFRYVSSYRELNPQTLTDLMETATSMVKSDITLYTPEGKAFRSTSPEVFDLMYLSDRINGDAYNGIVYGNKRFVINRERSGPNRFTALYAPLFNDSGKMIAIVCSPYSDANYDFQTDAVMHAVSIFTVFLILLILARFMVSSIVDRLFEPLVEIGNRMNKKDVENLAYIDYDREDEVSTLVKAYNLMVHDLAESSQILAQAERDKAWHSMARQVAHEIKNPLTPMKLQLQRLIRLKQKDAPGWQDKFDDVAAVVLDHIDILTDTANEFSTFAKLDTEVHTEINIDRLIQEEISMFDNKENVTFSYMGLDDALIFGPKPQLTRVIVNLLTNSVQAIEIAQQEAVDRGEEKRHGHINVSLRNSSQEGWFDIVFEDNGPGVNPDNQDKLFTPNFTTKTGGTGLGLAICRSILEKCGAGISYSRSFTLEGACFTIKYPKYVR